MPLDERQKQSTEDSCIQCHMPKSDISNVPHTVQTDHRILRTPQSSPTAPQMKAWTVVDGAQDRLPAWEVARARGLAMMTAAVKKRDQAMAIKARQYLVPEGIDPVESPRIIAALANDTESLSAIASSYWLEGLFANARPFWEKTLELEPFHETALSGLIQIDLDSNDLNSAERNAKKLTEFAPAESTHWTQLSTIQWKMTHYADAIKAAEKAIALDPNLDDTRSWLTQAKKKLAEGIIESEE
jgi:tetratricopeptide (TPR) repeat protein